MESALTQELIQKQEWLQPIEEGLQKVVSGAYAAAGPTGKKVQSALNGVWLGHPLHPVLTDVPLGAWTAALVMDTMDSFTGRRDFARGADAAIAVGLAGAAAAAVTGLTDWKDIDGRARRTGLVHGLLNLTGTALYTASLIKRRSYRRGAGKGLALAGFAVAAAAAWLGGNLVYGEQVGVDHTAGKEPPHDFVPVLPEPALDEGALVRVEHDGFPVLLVKRGGRIHAIAETCSHLGGPLAEGKLEDNSVRCPWHGSLFSLEDGRVLEGPATHGQPCFETRVRDGRIEIRSAR